MAAALLSSLLAALIAAQPAPDNRAAAEFAAEAGGLRHIASGYFCPPTIPDATLVGSRPGDPTDPSATGAYCEYREAGQPVAYLSISPEASPALTDEFCQSLPKALKLEIGPRLPGIRQYDALGPWPEALGAPTVEGEPVAPSTCTLSRPPQIIVYSAAAFTRSDWTVRAITTPIQPPCCAGHRGARLIAKDLLALVLITATTEAYTPPSSVTAAPL